MMYGVNRMKAEQVSYSPQFTGKVFYVDVQPVATNISEKINQYIPNFPAEVLAKIKDAIAPKPYDLFISRTHGADGFYEVSANTNYRNILSGDKSKKSKSSAVFEKKLERFSDAAIEAMFNFERLPEYKEILRAENSFWNVIKKLFKKKENI